MPRLITIIGFILMIIAVLIGINGTSGTPDFVTNHVLGTTICQAGERFVQTHSPDADIALSCTSPTGTLRDVTLMSYFLSFVVFVVLVVVGLYMMMWGLKRRPIHNYKHIPQDMRDYLENMSFLPDSEKQKHDTSHIS